MAKKSKKYAIEKLQENKENKFQKSLEHTVKEDVISVLNKVIEAIGKGDLGMIREQSDHIIHCSAIFQRQESIQTAVVIYALAKILERGKTIDAKVIGAMRQAISFMQVDNLRGFNTEIHALFEMINTVDNQLSNYMQHVVTEAQIKKGSKIYEHGISLGQTAEIFGLSQWELMKYIGKTRVSEDAVETIPIEQRMSFMRKLFS